MANKGDENNIPADAGVSLSWLRAVVADKVEKPSTWTLEDVKGLGPKRPESRIQEILQQFYWDLIDILKAVKFTEDGAIITEPDEDSFDKWYENNELGKYTHKPRLMDVFNTIARSCSISEAKGYEAEDFETILSKILDRCMEEHAYLEIVAKVINERYPGLASPFRSTPTAEEMREYEQLFYQQRLGRAISTIDTNIEQFEEELRRIEAAAKTDFEIMARTFNELVIVGADIWELTLYNLMSPYAPRFLMNSLDYRPNVHEILVGDIGTGKSKVLKIAKMIAPKMVTVDKVTTPTFEGIAPVKTGGDIEEGVIDWAKDAVMIVEEFTKVFSQMPLFRRVMDGEHIRIFKKGTSKDMHPNTTMLTACNPNDDFFLEETSFRSQIAFKEGVLSRFDIVIPITATQLKNALLADKIDLFGTKVGTRINFEEIQIRLETLSHGMQQIRIVVLTEDQKTALRQAFKDQNNADRGRRRIKNRPLVILRDLESLARLVNIIATVNFNKRKVENGVLHADDADIHKAIQLWENLLGFRVQIYARSSRNLVTVSDEMLAFLGRVGGSEDWISLNELFQEFVMIQRSIGRTTFYKEVQSLIEEGRIVADGKRDRSVKLVIRA